jgi:hypothetical protein
MNLLRNIMSELIGLLVDDWAFALLILAWVGLFALPGVRAHAVFAGPLLFLGLAVLTLVFVARKARR